MYTLSNDQEYRGPERRVVRQRFKHFINTVHLISYSYAPLLGYQGYLSPNWGTGNLSLSRLCALFVINLNKLVDGQL